MFEQEFISWNLQELTKRIHSICRCLEDRKADTMVIHHTFTQLEEQIRAQAAKVAGENV